MEDAGKTDSRCQKPFGLRRLILRSQVLGLIRALSN